VLAKSARLRREWSTRRTRRGASSGAHLVRYFTASSGSTSFQLRNVRAETRVGARLAEAGPNRAMVLDYSCGRRGVQDQTGENVVSTQNRWRMWTRLGLAGNVCKVAMSAVLARRRPRHDLRVLWTPRGDATDLYRTSSRARGHARVRIACKIFRCDKFLAQQTYKCEVNEVAYALAV
jgi:hypothetical protein